MNNKDHQLLQPSLQSEVGQPELEIKFWEWKDPSLMNMSTKENKKNLFGQNAPRLDTAEAKLNWIFSIYDADDGGRFR